MMQVRHNRQNGDNIAICTGLKEEIVVLELMPVIEPGLIVQLPVGRLLRMTLPVVTVHVGWVIVPTAGAAGMSFTVNV